MKIKTLLLYLCLILLLSCGGGGGSESETTSSGWHYQGRDCLNCHDSSLSSDKHLNVAGTVFNSSSVSNIDDLSNIYSGILYMQFLDKDSTVVYDSKNYVDSASEGYRGKGNTFILNRSLTSLQGDYYIKITTDSGETIAQSMLHRFDTSYDANNPSDLNNRHSCNTCHSTEPTGGASGLLYPNYNGMPVGWHYQGRDCLNCHNVSSDSSKYLTIGGTVYMSQRVSNADDLTDVCNTKLYIQFLDINRNVVYDTSDYSDYADSEGYNLKGNFFLLSRQLSSLQGDYYINIITEDGTLIAQSFRHRFLDSYNPDNPDDTSNRYSCNTCHKNTRPEGNIYAQNNTEKCK